MSKHIIATAFFLIPLTSYALSPRRECFNRSRQLTRAFKQACAVTNGQAIPTTTTTQTTYCTPLPTTSTLPYPRCEGELNTPCGSLTRCPTKFGRVGGNWEGMLYCQRNGTDVYEVFYVDKPSANAPGNVSGNGCSGSAPGMIVCPLCCPSGMQVTR